jgi:hypothetical protein
MEKVDPLRGQSSTFVSGAHARRLRRTGSGKCSTYGLDVLAPK